MLSMRGGYLILGLLFCCCFLDPAVADPRWPEKPPPEFAGPYTGDLTVYRVPLITFAKMGGGSK
jgi:hypothetical protein